MQFAHFKHAVILFGVFIFLDLLAFSAQSEIVKHPQDPRAYTTFKLKNGMRIILASDPNATQSYAALTVGVGSYHDPDTFPGLAHYLEHMIFMGSENHPESNALKGLVEAHGGGTNAFTTGTSTNYLFAVDANQFEPALTLMSDAIRAPIFNEDAALGEINAVHTEWTGLYQTDEFVIQRVLANTSNSSHPARKLQSGNTDSLRDHNEQPLLGALKEFHQRYYSSNIMTLVLVGNQPLATLKNMAERHFAQIQNKAIDKPQITAPLFTDDDLAQNIYVKTNQKQNLLMMQFPMHDNTADYASKTNEFLSYLMSSQEPGGLYAVLSEQGWINGLSMFILPNNFGVDGNATIAFGLTDEGSAHKNAIVATTFDFLAQIQQNGIQPGFEKELRRNLIQSAKQSATLPALQVALNLANNASVYPVDHVLTGPTQFTGLNQAHLDKVLSHFKPQNMRLWHISDRESTNSNLVFADGSYRSAPFTPDDYQQWQDVTLQASLPLPSISADSISELVARDANYRVPQVVHAKPGVRAMLKHSEAFQGEDGLLNITLRTPSTAENAAQHVDAYIANLIFQEQQGANVQRWARQHGVNVELSNNGPGNTVIRMFGNSAKHGQIALELVQAFRDLSFSKKDVKRFAKLHRDGLNSIEELKLTAQLEYYALEYVQLAPFIFDKDDKLDALQNSSVETVASIHKAMSAEAFIDIFAVGNYSAEQSQMLASELREILGEPKQQTAWYHETPFEPKPGVSRSKKLSVSKDNVGIVDTYIYPEQSLQFHVQLQLINQLFSNVFFGQLRTRLQLGYDVSSYATDIHGYPALSMRVESNNTDLQTLKESILSFQVAFSDYLKSVDEKQVLEVANAAAKAENPAPTSLLEESLPFEQDWSLGRLSFDTKTQRQEIFRATTKADLVALYDKIFIDSHYSNRMVQLKGKKFKDTEYFRWGNIGK